MSKHSAINRFGRSSNPAFSRNFNQGGFRTQSSSEMNVGSGFRTTSSVAESADLMTLDGAVNKTGILLALCFVGAVVGWNIPALILPAGILGFILGLVTIFRTPSKAGTTAPFYALAQGVMLGGISLMYENLFYDGITIQAIGLTFGISQFF